MKKCLAICFYLFLITAFLRFDIWLLFDARQFFLVVFGAALLYLPALGGKQERFHFDREFFGQNSLWASIIQTFVLLFVVLSEGQSREEMMVQTAMACRPLLYGFCLWVVFTEDSLDMPGKREKQGIVGEAELTADMGEKTETTTNGAEGTKTTTDLTEVMETDTALAEKTGANTDMAERTEPTTDTGEGVESLIHNQQPRPKQQDINLPARSDGVAPQNHNESAREYLAGLGLTRREIEVALLTAANLSNAEIAAELFISETTVKKHLSNIYGKLGISKRGQIAELFRK